MMKVVVVAEVVGASQQPDINYVEACKAGSRAGDIYKRPARCD